MREFIKIGDCILYHGDAIEIMPELKCCADLIVCDPPYKLTSGGKTGKMGGCFDVAQYDNGGSIVECNIDWPDFMPLLYGVLRAGHAYIMANNRNVHALIDAARWPVEVSHKNLGRMIGVVQDLMRGEISVKAAFKSILDIFFIKSEGFEFHNWLVWDKGVATPNRWYMKNCEFVALLYKGKARYINDCGAKQLISCPQVDVSGAFDANDISHPTEKPVALMRYYIEQSSDEGETVFDGFMGSGTTGVAAVMSGRKFIGIEKDKKFFDMAVKRIQHAVDNFQPRLI